MSPHSRSGSLASGRRAIRVMSGRCAPPMKGSLTMTISSCVDPADSGDGRLPRPCSIEPRWIGTCSAWATSCAVGIEDRAGGVHALLDVGRERGQLAELLPSPRAVASSALRSTSSVIGSNARLGCFTARTPPATCRWHGPWRDRRDRGPWLRRALRSPPVPRSRCQPAACCAQTL